jgi:hypothetical protein
MDNSDDKQTSKKMKFKGIQDYKHYKQQKAVANAIFLRTVSEENLTNCRQEEIAYKQMLHEQKNQIFMF